MGGDAPESSLRSANGGAVRSFVGGNASDGRPAGPAPLSTVIGMQKIVELIGFLIAVQGVVGFIDYFFGASPVWFLAKHMDFYAGNEVFTNIVLLVLGVAVMAAGGAVGRALR